MFVFLCAVFVAAISLSMFYNALTRRYVNRWKLTMVFGKKGSGKTTYLSKQALRHASMGWTVYSTVNIPFTYAFNPNDLGVYATPAALVNPFTAMRLPERGDLRITRKMRKLMQKIMTVRPNGNVLIMVDEVGMIWDNRNFKKFAETTRDWFKLQRHYKCKVYLFSQAFDIDKKLRDLCDDMWLLVSKFRVLSYGKHILRRMDIIEAQGEAESRIVDQLKFDSLLFAFFGSRQLTYIPFWAQLFDSFDVPELKEKEYVLYPSRFLVASTPAGTDEAQPAVPAGVTRKLTRFNKIFSKDAFLKRLKLKLHR